MVQYKPLIFIVNRHGLFLWKIKKVLQLLIFFQKILDEFNREPNKIWVHKGSKFYNRSMKSWLQDNDIEIYSLLNEKKSVVAERFISTLTNKIYKYMTSISKKYISVN